MSDSMILKRIKLNITTLNSIIINNNYMSFEPNIDPRQQFILKESLIEFKEEICKPRATYISILNSYRCPIDIINIGYIDDIYIYNNTLFVDILCETEQTFNILSNILACTNELYLLVITKGRSGIRHDGIYTESFFDYIFITNDAYNPYTSFNKEGSENKVEKRKDYISWNEYFMSIAKLIALRSKDPVKQVGCCIVKDNKILSTGYNGFPMNCSDDEFPWGKENKDPLEDKRLYIVHAELNAILNSSGRSLENSKIYVTLFPCNECAKAIIQSGIKEVIYLEDEDSVKTKASKRMFDSAGIKYTQYKSDIDILFSTNKKEED